jgi:putative ABC transport system ATP-binding protein
MIDIQHLNKAYRENKRTIIVFSNFNLQIEKGKTVLISGPSGGGKSTLLALIAGLSKPDSGEIRVLGKALAKLPDPFTSQFRRRNIGFILQKFHLINGLSAYENVATPLLPEALSQNEIRQRCISALAHFSLAEKAHTRVEKLSGGEQQRVAIARALIHEPPLILADEPSAHLDRELSEKLLVQLQTLRNAGKTLLIASHDPLFAEQDWIDVHYRLHEGQLT